MNFDVRHCLFHFKTNKALGLMKKSTSPEMSHKILVVE